MSEVGAFFFTGRVSSRPYFACNVEAQNKKSAALRDRKNAAEKKPMKRSYRHPSRQSNLAEFSGTRRK